MIEAITPIIDGFKNTEKFKSNFDKLPKINLDNISPFIKESNTEIQIPEEIFKNCPENNGYWDGERGNSNWYPDPDFVPGKANSEGKTWSEILNKYDINNISFKDGNPDFDKISKGNIEIEGFSESRTDNFDKADMVFSKQKNISPEEIEKWRKENGYTWHECRDMKTMQLVPSEIHNNIPHSGGISEIKKMNGDNI